jgi:multiple sugar transport system substrate-binding protein
MTRSVTSPGSSTPLGSVTRRRSLALVAAAAVAALALTGCTPGTTGDTEVVTVRLWDPQVAEAYEASFAEFEQANPGVRVEVSVIPWADYFTRLRTDLATGSIDDIFWTNAGNVAAYAEAGRLLDISAAIGVDPGWSANVVEQYTVGGSLWGVPQLTDPGIGILYNAELLEAAGVPVEAVEQLRWDPSGADDTLRELATALTLDTSGRTPDAADFDASRVQQYGYSAGNDLNAITINFIGSNGGAWQRGDEFVFDSPESTAAVEYVVDLVTERHVAPPAADTNPPTGGDTARDLFLQGRIALFQTGAYNLANVLEGASFEWGIAPLPTGPARAISVTNGIIAAGRTDSAHPQAQLAVLEWLGSAEGSRPIGETGSALPAVLEAQAGFFEFWAGQGVDVSPLMDVLGNGFVQAPQGARYAAAEEAYRPILNEIFLGRRPVAEGLAAAAAAANAAMRE